MLTVLIATHNGAQTLERLLESFTKMEEPVGGYKLVVVDNASTDSTPHTLSSYKERLPITVIHTEKQGKNIALNIGLEYLEGDLVVLTDDDTQPRADWLVQHRTFADKNPSVAMWGGAIVPVWPAPPEPWLLNQAPLGAVFALTDSSQKTGPTNPDMVWGPNMAIRSEVFEAGHRFNEHIGPAAGQYTMGSEVEFTCRVAQEGHKSWFLAEAVVGHMIRPNQMKRNWVIKRAYRFGRLKHMQKKNELAHQKNLYRGVPRWRYGAVIYSTVKSVYYLISGNQSARFKADWDKQYHLGYISSAFSDEKD